jgi:hypothetical protein
VGCPKYFLSDRIQEGESNLVDLPYSTIRAMANKSPYHTTFEPERTIQPIYTGGSVALDGSGRIFATTLGEDALITDLDTGRELARIEGVSLPFDCVFFHVSMSLLTVHLAGWRADIYPHMYVWSARLHLSNLL